MHQSYLYKWIDTLMKMSLTLIAISRSSSLMADNFYPTCATTESIVDATSASEKKVGFNTCFMKSHNHTKKILFLPSLLPSHRYRTIVIITYTLTQNAFLEKHVIFTATVQTPSSALRFSKVFFRGRYLWWYFQYELANMSWLT